MTLRAFYLILKNEFKKEFNLKNKRAIEDLLSFHLNKTWGELQLIDQVEIPEQEIEKIKESILKLKSGTPVSYITNRRYFYETDFYVDSRVLIPRPETEILVEKTLTLINTEKAVIFDFGSGSGCIGLSIAKIRPKNNIFLFDKSSEALEVSLKNSQEMMLTNVEQCQYDLSGDFMFPVKEQAHIIVANPPYIKMGDQRVEKSVHLHEPHMALYSDENGLKIPKLWIKKSYDLLIQGGYYLFEFGQNQEKPLTDFIESTDYSIIEVIADYSGIKRFFKLKKE